MTAIGAASKTTVEVRTAKADGTRTDAVTSESANADVLQGNTDGWRAADGTFVDWGNSSATYCIKFNPQLSNNTIGDATNQIAYVGGHINGNTNTAGTYTAQYVYTNTSNGYEALVNVALKYKAEFSYQTETRVGSTASVNYWQAAPITVDIAAIKTAIGSTADNDYTVYSEQLNGTRIEGVIKNETINGWRNANGDIYQFDGGAFYLQNPSNDLTNYVIGGNYNTCQTPITYTTKLVYRHNITHKEAVVYISLNYIGDIFFYANDKKVSLETGDKYEGIDYDGYRGTYTLEATVTDGTLDFGFDVALGLWKWLSFKDVKIYYLGAKGLKVSDGLPAALATLKSTKTPVSASDVKRYLVRFTSEGWGSKGQYWQMQMGTGSYVVAPTVNGALAECGDAAGKFYVYNAEGTRHDEVMGQDLWTVTKDIVLVKSTDGGGYLYYMHDNGVNDVVSFTTNPNSTDERWGIDINGNIPFTLYPVDVCEKTPDTPVLTAPETSTTAAPKFYKIKSVGQNDYASYSSITASQYPQLVDFSVGGYAIMGRTASNVTGNSYWWFSDAFGEGYQNQGSKGSKRVHIHNVMMHDVDYSYENHRNEALHSPVFGMVRMYRDEALTQPTDSCLYYLLPTTAGGQNGFAISRSEYSGTPNDSWYSAEEVVDEIGQHSTLSGERNYKVDANSLYTFELASAQDVWEEVVNTKRADMHEGAYFSPTKETLDAIFGKTEYQKANITDGNFFTRLNSLSRELYDAATNPSLPTLAPETGGRFYFKNYAVPTHYLAYGNDMDTEQPCLTITEADKPEAANVWEVLPFSDPTLIVRLDDQPRYNGFPSAFYETLPHKPLQRFWLRNRATGHFVTHAPVDKSSLDKLGEGVWRMYDGDGNFLGGSLELGTVNSLNREGADLWYLDVITDPRTGVRTGVLRTLFCYDYGPWAGTSWDGRYSANGRAIGETGAAIAGYNYPVIQWSLNRHIYDNRESVWDDGLGKWVSQKKPAGNCVPTLYSWGVTATDHTKSFSQWVIYDIDTDLPEVGVNYTFKNKYSGKYAYWDGSADGGSLKQVESVEDLDDIGDKKPNRGVWTLVDLATPASDHWRIANRWAVETNQTKQKLNPLKLEYTVAEHKGSTFYLPTSNVDPKGIAISLNADLATSNCLLSYEDKSGVTQDKSENDRAVWGIDKVDRMYDDVIYDLNKMLGNLHGGDSYFYVDKEAVKDYNSQIEAWNTYVENTRTNSLTDSQRNNEYPTYKTIKDLVNGKIGDDKFVMPVKKTGSGNRYLIRNKETKRYLTNLGQLTTVDEDNLSYYSFWNLALEETESGSKYLYTLTNEGAANVMDAQGDSRKKNDNDKYMYKYMTFDDTAGDNGFKMSDAEMKLHFRPDGEGFARLHYYRTGDKNMDDDLVLYGPTWGDRVVQSKDWRNNNVYWEVIPVADFLTDERSVDYLKTEKALVQHSINELEGYSGGPISLTDVNSTVVGAGTGSYDLKTLPGAVSRTAGSIASLGAIIRNMWEMDEKFLLQWKAGYPVYIENVFRPSRNARLTAGTGEEAWTTTETKNDDEASQTFEFETATDGKVYLWNKSETKYVKASTADDEAVASTTTDADKAQLTVKEILPGMYSMMDVAGRYLSIDDDGNVEWMALCGYGSLWRIKCNDYLQPNIAQVPAASDLWAGKYVNTFYSDYDTRIEKSTGVKAYYAKNAANDGISIGSNEQTVNEQTVTQNQLQITFTEVPTLASDGYYYLQGGQPYMLVKTGGKVTNDELKVWSQHKGKYEDGTLNGKNLLSRLSVDTEIDADNQRKIFELNYIAPGTQIGTLVGHPVYAFGIGFYPVKIGRTLPAGTVVIHSEMLGAWIGNLRGSYTSVKGEAWAPSLQIILEDEDGTTTALDELMAAEEMTEGPVYDLSGRKVSDSFRDVTRKGMYIVNGQKVMKK
mgnify:CR=1 FL=1